MNIIIVADEIRLVLGTGNEVCASCPAGLRTSCVTAIYEWRYSESCADTCRQGWFTIWPIIVTHSDTTRRDEHGFTVHTLTNTLPRSFTHTNQCRPPLGLPIRLILLNYVQTTSRLLLHYTSTRLAPLLLLACMRAATSYIY